MERMNVGPDRETVPAVDRQSDELYGPYLYAPVWPWLVAGWTFSALSVVSFVLAWWIY